MRKKVRTDATVRRIPIYEDNVMTLETFLQRNKLSRSTYYAMRRAGQGPVEMRIGRSIRISYRAERKWTRLMEAEPMASVDDAGKSE